jgi:hypothetical protein
MRICLSRLPRWPCTHACALAGVCGAGAWGRSGQAHDQKRARPRDMHRVGGKWVHGGQRTKACLSVTSCQLPWVSRVGVGRCTPVGRVEWDWPGGDRAVPWRQRPVNGLRVVEGASNAAVVYELVRQQEICAMSHFLFSEMKKAGRGRLWECLTFRGLGNVMDPWPKTLATHNRTADICTRAEVNIVATTARVSRKKSRESSQVKSFKIRALWGTQIEDTGIRLTSSMNSTG